MLCSRILSRGSKDEGPIPVSANAARQDSDRDFLIIADHPLDRESITKLKDGLYDIELGNDEVVSSIMRSRQEWSSPEYNALLFKKVVERVCVEL